MSWGKTQKKYRYFSVLLEKEVYSDSNESVVTISCNKIY